MQKVVNKYKLSRKYVILLSVVILAVLLLFFVVGNCKTLASADTNRGVEYASYRYEVFNSYLKQEKLRAAANLDLPIMIMQGDAAFSPSEIEVEYILEIDPYRLYVPDDLAPNYRTENDTVSLSFVNFPKDEEYSFLDILIYYGGHPLSYAITWSSPTGDYGWRNISNSAFVGDLFYLTVTNSGLFFSTCSFYGDNVLDNRSGYERSLDNIVLSLEVNSSGFSAITQGFSTNSPRLCFQYNNSDAYFACSESYKLYKTVDVPYKEGHEFAGWYYDKEFTRPYNNEPISSDIELYAKFVPITYTVYFDTGAVEDPDDPNSSGLYDTSIQVEYGGVAEYTPDVGDDKHLLGWFFADGTQYMNTPIYEDTRLYAKWGCLITFDVNGGNEEIESMVCELGQRYEFPKPTRDEYDFLYWEPVDIQVWHDGDPILYDMDLVAVWEKNVFIVTFYVDDEIFAEVKVNKGDKLYSVYAETIVDDKVVVGYENVNVATIAASFDEIVVEDDMIVYLVENDDNSNSNDVSMSFWDQIKAFFAKIAEFFKKIFAWIKNLFKAESTNVVNDQSEEPALSSFNSGEETVSSSAAE